MKPFWKKCRHCKSSDNVKTICFSSWYESWRVYYHDGCVREVLCNPEKYSNAEIYWASSIVEKQKEQVLIRNDKIKKARMLCNELD
jgi:hypothetical protein